MVSPLVEAGIGSVGRHKGHCHLFHMVPGGAGHERARGSTSARIASISDCLAEGTKETDAFVVGEVIEVDVVAEAIAVGELDPTNKRPILLLVGAGGDGMFAG